MLDEVALRKMEFTEGHRIKLADGQEWAFPKPRLRYGPVLNPDGSIGVTGGRTFDDEYKRLFTQYVETDSEDVHACWTLQMQLACHLLLANYNLTIEHLAELLPIEFEDDANMAMWSSLAPVLLAQPPKPSASGLSALSSPTECPAD